MTMGICGKSCEYEYCELRQELNCPGCRMGPGNEMYGDCPIAECSRARKTDGCESCPSKVGCTDTAIKELIPHRRKTAYASKVAREAVMTRRGPYMKKLLWLLFWLAIARVVGLSSNFDEGTSLYRGFQCLEDSFGIAMALVLVTLSKEERGYLIPGCILAGISVHDFLLHLMTVNGMEPGWALLTVLVMPFVSMAQTYLLMTAHAQAAQDVDLSLSEKWLKLRKWFLITLTGIQICEYVYVFFPLLVSIAVAVFGLMLVVLSILELVYLYRMAKGYSRF